MRITDTNLLGLSLLSHSNQAIVIRVDVRLGARGTNFRTVFISFEKEMGNHFLQF